MALAGDGTSPCHAGLLTMAGLLGFRGTEGREPKEHWQSLCPAKNPGTPRDPPEDRLFAHIAHGLVATCK